MYITTVEFLSFYSTLFLNIYIAISGPSNHVKNQKYYGQDFQFLKIPRNLRWRKKIGELIQRFQTPFEPSLLGKK